MRSRIAGFVVLLMMMAAGPVLGQDTGAKTSGNWENASIWTGGAVPNASNNVYIGSTTPSGAAATATVSLTADESAANVFVGDGSGANGTLNLGGKALTVSKNIDFGDGGGQWSFNEGGGSFTAGTASFTGGNPFTFGASDSVGALNVNNDASVSTTATGNVTNGVSVSNGTLTLGASMNLTGSVNIEGGSGALDMAGHGLTASSLDISDSGPSFSQVVNPGAIAVSNVNVNLSSFYMSEHLTAASLSITDGFSVDTSATGNVSGSVLVQRSGLFGPTSTTLTLGADMTLTNDIDLVGYEGETHGPPSQFVVLDAGGHALTANSLSLEGPAIVEDLGKVTLNNLLLESDNQVLIGEGQGGEFILHGGDTINSSILVKNDSVMDVEQLSGIGLTLNGTTGNSLGLDFHGMLLDSNGPGWVFRWKDPSGGGNWVGTLDSMIDGGLIKIDLLTGDDYSVYDLNGYTYIGVSGPASVPEPSSLVLLGLGALGVVFATRKRGRSRGRDEAGS